MMLAEIDATSSSSIPTVSTVNSHFSSVTQSPAVSRRVALHHTIDDNKHRCSSDCPSNERQRCETIHGHRTSLILSALIFALVSGVGIFCSELYCNSSANEKSKRAFVMAAETSEFLANELERAVAPLFSIALFATEVQKFRQLPSAIRAAYMEGSTPFRVNEDGATSSKRNATSVCDQPDLVETFDRLVSVMLTTSPTEGVLHSIQLAPEGVTCLSYPLVFKKDFDGGGRILDSSTSSPDLDLLTIVDDQESHSTRTSFDRNELSIVGPQTLSHCHTCGLYYIARLPIINDPYDIETEENAILHWGFATALISWNTLVESSMVHKRNADNGFEFSLMQKKQNVFNQTTNQYDESVVVLAESASYTTTSKRFVVNSVRFRDTEWVSTVQYNTDDRWRIPRALVSMLLGLCMSSLLYVILTQRRRHAVTIGQTTTYLANLESERKVTAYFAHELRNPLSAIDNALRSMPEGIPDDAAELVTSMRICSSFMSSMMNNLLDVRKIEEGKVVLRPEPLCLKTFIEDVGKMVQPTVSPGVQLVISSKVQTSKWVLGDRHRLQQILNNIISNAVKYTTHGSIKIAVCWDKQCVRFECEDTGSGIPKEDQEKVFERFIQRGGAPGSGLGLAISKNLVDQMNGSIRFESDPIVKPGTKCIVVLPLEVCAPPEVSPAPISTVLDEPLSILIVDDIEMNRQMLKRRLKKSIAPNCTAAEATTGERALEMCKVEQFDVIIVDQYMEEAGGIMVGTEVITAMRKMRLDSIIVGCSGNDMETEFHSAGADLVWTKPMPPNKQIIHQLRRLVFSRVQR